MNPAILFIPIVVALGALVLDRRLGARGIRLSRRVSFALAVAFILGGYLVMTITYLIVGTASSGDISAP